MNLQRYEQLLRFIPVGVCSWNVFQDGSTELEYSNEKFCTLLGIEHEPVHQNPHFLFSSAHPGNAEGLTSALAAARKMQVPLNWEGCFVVDGLERWIRILADALDHADGSYTWNCAAFDITESKYALLQSQESERKFKAMAAGTFEGLAISIDGKLVDVNDQLTRLLGFERSELVGQFLPNIISFEDPERTFQMVREGVELYLEGEVLRKDGSRVIVETHGQTIEQDGKPIRLTAVRDITQRKYAEDTLRENELRFRSIIEQSPAGISFTRDGVTIEVNLAFAEMYGYGDPAEMKGQLIVDRIAPSERSAMEARIKKRSQGDETDMRYETIGLRKDGTEFPILVTAKRMVLGDGPISTAFVIDLTSSKQSEETIRHLALFDNLTGLPNRQLAFEQIQHAVHTSELTKQHCALLYLDLDNFKLINEGHNHEVGDQLLNQVAQRLKASARPSDIIARVGGDEFMILIEGLSIHDTEAAIEAEEIAASILSTVSQPFNIGELTYYGTASVGITVFSGQANTPDELLKHADMAVYQAKNDGRNLFRFYESQMQDAIKSHFEIVSGLYEALEKGLFDLHYQIQVDDSGRPIGAESLIRWVHPERGIVPPNQFIPLAEDTGLIIPIGQWVLEEACGQLDAWRRNRYTEQLVLSVNISARQFHSDDFLARVQNAIQRYDIDPGLLKLELTESLLLENTEETIVIIDTLKRQGIQISLDDFGTGYSSIQYLYKLPLDQLKIDQSFVRNLTTDSGAQAVVKTIISMAHNLGLEVIAEGVETEEQRQFLADNGCRFYQGYLFGQPVPNEKFEEILLLDFIGQLI